MSRSVVIFLSIFLLNSQNKNGQSLFQSLMSDSLLFSSCLSPGLSLDLTQDLKVLTNLWTSAPKYSNKKLLAGWLLSCCNLEFTNDIIINATFDTTKFRQKCRPYLTQLLNDIATRLQSIGRMYLARKKVQKKRSQQERKKIKKGRNKRLKQKLSETSLQMLSSDEQSLASIATEYSSSPHRHQPEAVISGSALETNSLISVEAEGIPFSSSTSASMQRSFSSVANEKSKNMKSLEGKKPLSQPMTKRLKETLSAYSSPPKKKPVHPSSSSTSVSQRSLQPPASSALLDTSTGSSDLMMEQIKYLKSDLNSALSHKQHASEFSQMREMMKTVMREIQTLRHSEDRRSYSSPASHSVPRTKTLSHNSSENQFELKDNLNSMFSQILNIQKDLSEQKALSSNISLQLQEQSQVILTSLSQQAKKPSSSASEATSEALQDQNEEFYLQQKKYENELEKLTQLLQHKDQNIQKEVIQKNNLQREINELKRETERQQSLLSELERNFTQKKRENEMSKQMVERLEREHGVKQRELMSQIHSTVSQLQGTQEELENYQRNVNELKLNYQNSLLEISVLKREIQNKEKERQEKERQERVREERERHEREGQETQESKAMRDSFENQKIEFQQKIAELEKKNLVMEQSAGSLHAEKTRMTQEMMQQQDLINQFRSQALERETLTKSLERKIVTLEKEEQIHREAIAEKDRYVGTIQAKLSELELKVLNLTNLI
jgi:hypothetical protein